MSASLLLAAAVASSPIIKDGMTEAERYNALKPYFDPSPGGIVSVNPADVEAGKSKHNPMLYKLYVSVNPPKGHCFRITRSPQTPDISVCKPTQLATLVGDISASGQFSWTISTGKDDFGYSYTWNTPHRVAQKIPAGTREVVSVPVLSCTPFSNSSERSIVLNFMDNERWSITFPESDKLEEQPPPLPNLYLAERTSSGGISANSEVSVPSTDHWAYLKSLKPEDPVTKHWVIRARNHFRMPASNLKITDTPPGEFGSCRYQYYGAAKDQSSGWIECHEADKYDVIFTHLSCAGILIKSATN